ncbi:MAG: CDGSH-type Zn-finger protein [Crocinitomix sp.]|jgi:CDGSH-type Zn-finger protein
MDKAKVAGKAPVMVEAIKDKNYAWCTCGLSENQPYCNGSHKGTSFTPQICVETEDKKVFLCACKQTSNPPYCDGSHAKL